MRPHSLPVKPLFVVRSRWEGGKSAGPGFQMFFPMGTGPLPWAKSAEAQLWGKSRAGSRAPPAERRMGSNPEGRRPTSSPPPCCHPRIFLWGRTPSPGPKVCRCPQCVSPTLQATEMLQGWGELSQRESDLGEKKSPPLGSFPWATGHARLLSSSGCTGDMQTQHTRGTEGPGGVC